MIPTSTDALYRALLRRDPDYDGRVYVGVTSTGVFCRLTCPARKPKAENCRFFETVHQCFGAGFRPCKRCRPLGAEADSDPVVQRLLAELNEDPSRRWSEPRIEALGIDPSTARRAFQKHFGVTFIQFARHARVGPAIAALQRGEQVIAAQLEAGFESGSGFRSAIGRWLGVAPHALTKQAELRVDWIQTPLGPMVAVADRDALHLLEFADRKALPRELRTLLERSPDGLGLGRHDPIEQVAHELDGYFAGRSTAFATPLALRGSAFSRAVWAKLREIPVGRTRSYADIARALGNPRAVRAVARANGTNQLAIVVPCHRVIGSDGAMTGYGGGLWRKQRLIALESEQRVHRSNPKEDPRR